MKNPYKDFVILVSDSRNGEGGIKINVIGYVKVSNKK